MDGGLTDNPDFQPTQPLTIGTKQSYEIVLQKLLLQNNSQNTISQNCH
jgi:hypothetical protein